LRLFTLRIHKIKGKLEKIEFMGSIFREDSVRRQLKAEILEKQTYYVN
jgi:hypothetical protein